MTEKEIRDAATMAHDTLSKAYYSGHANMTKAQFDGEHAAIWNDLQVVLLAAGYIQPPAKILEERIRAVELKVGL